MDRVEFTHLVFLLMMYANRLGLPIALDYGKRSKEEQARLFAEGKSKTLNSQHNVGKAVDFIIFDDSTPRQPQWTHPGYKLLGEYWKSLKSGNRWGGDWPELNDVYHFDWKEK